MGDEDIRSLCGARKNPRNIHSNGETPTGHEECEKQGRIESDLCTDLRWIIDRLAIA